MAANATAVWRVRPSGNNNNGGGYDSGIASAGTDFSQQNAAQVTQSGGTISTATVTLTDTGASFTSALIGNGIRVAGTGITTTYTFVTAVPSGTTLTLQTSPGTTGTSVTYSIGGGWADYWTVPGGATSPLVGDNTVYILGSGIPNPASYTYDYDGSSVGALVLPGGANTCSFLNDPATPSYKAPPDTTGGMPVTKFNRAGNIIGINGFYFIFAGLWFVGTTTAASKYFFTGTGSLTLLGCVLDQFGFDLGLMNVSPNQPYYDACAVGCEVYSSVPAGAGTASAFLAGDGTALYVDSCNIHDCIGKGISGNASNNPITITNNIVAKCGGQGISLSGSGGTSARIKGNTVDGNGGTGIFAGSQIVQMYSNIISNHTAGGSSGLNISHPTFSYVDYNVYYNNTTDITGSTYGPHDTHGGSNPYVGQATENYTLA